MVDSGASMHMVSEKDPNSAELETMRISRNPTICDDANGEVRTNKEATVYVKQLDLLVKVMLLEETSAVLVKSTSPTTENWLRKLCTLQHEQQPRALRTSMTQTTSTTSTTNSYTRELHNL